MDRRKFIQRVLDNERVSRIPRAVFGGGLWAYDNCRLAITEIIEAPGRFSKALSGFYQGLDTDIIFPGSGLNSFPAEAIGGTLRFRGKQAPMLERPIIHTLEDMDRIETVDILKSPYTRALVEVIRGLRKGLPDRFICATSWGTFTWAFILCDEELLKKKVREDKAFIRAITELGARISTAFLDVLVREGLVDGISIPEGAVTLIPDEDYRGLVLPVEESFFRHFREQGVRGFLHMCGEIGPKLAFFADSGADCLSVDNHVPIAEAYNQYCDRTVTAGNVDVLNVIQKGDPALIRQAAKECIREVPDPYRRYILMPSCDIPLGTPIENVTAFLAGADERGAPV